jgi:hypothetical protein
MLRRALLGVVALPCHCAVAQAALVIVNGDLAA